MAGTSAISEVGSTILSKVFGGILWFGVAVICIGVVGALIWYFLIYKRSFNIDVTIKSERSKGGNIIIFDKAAILKDRKTKLPYIKLWSIGKSFTVPKFNIFQRSERGDFIEMQRTSEDDFFFLYPAKIRMDKIVRSDGKMYATATQEQMRLDPDVAFWAAKRKESNKKMFSTESIIMKLLPFLPQIIGGVIMIFVLYILLDHLPGILTELRKTAEILNQLYQAKQASGI